MNESRLAQATRLEAKRDYEGAITILNDLVRQDTTCVEAYIHLAADSGILGRFHQAELHARRAIALDPASGGARYYLGCALRDQGLFDEALRELEQSLVLAKREAEKQGSIAGQLGVSLPLSLGWNIEQAIRDLQIGRLTSGVRKKTLPEKEAPVFVSTPGKLKTYRNERHGFEIETPKDWSLSQKRAPFLFILISLVRGLRPYADVQFSCGPKETLNFVIERMQVEFPPDIHQLIFKITAQDMGYTDLEFGRITVGGRKHAWARYCIGGKVWSKKYMIVLGGIGYAITGSCNDNRMLAESERRWDAVVTSFRLLGNTDNSNADFTRHSSTIERTRKILEEQIARREAYGQLYARAYDATAEKRYSEALALLKRCLAEKPDHIMAHKEMAVVLKNLGHPEEALHHRREVKRLDPSDTVNRVNLAELLAGLGASREALYEADELLALEPDNQVFQALKARLQYTSTS
jgi:tetratricopeptide (TPR) repeat protein